MFLAVWKWWTKESISNFSSEVILKEIEIFTNVIAQFYYKF